ncbi:MAG: 50S ribosomal protein L13 [Deferribacteres bacterium]|nr:50S ribosomal protein L13 [candidate division KSB1 bacterium]MCB9511925.1 50S ribosomal protein L13 [Deferribacteres bacterium]
MKTYIPKLDEIEQKWFVVDADGKTLGRLASTIATILRGKNKPYFTPHLDTGDFVVVVNADKVRVTGKKAQQKVYSRYTGYPGGLRQVNLETLRRTHPERIIQSAVWGMLPNNRLGRKLLKKLHVYAGAEHPHAAQKPETLDIQA